MNEQFETCMATPLGPVRVAACDDRLVGLWFRGQKYEPPLAATGRTCPAATAAVLAAATRWLGDYFEGRCSAPLPALGPAGTEFQCSVWDGLQRLAPGTTSSYGHLAAAIGKPASTRAAAAAIGRNPISIMIPCHRVVGAGGQLTGYAGGLGRKRALLALESGQPLPWQRLRQRHQPQYPNPIEVAAGERVRFVDRSDDGEYPGWKWAIAADGRAGWVPREWFSADVADGRALRGYSARELAADAGTDVLELDRFSGWAWAIDRAGICGWLPLTAVAAG